MVSKNLCYLLGALRDGSLPVCGKKKEGSLASDWSGEWLELVAEKAAEEFSIPRDKLKTYSVWDRKSQRPCYRLKIYSKKIYERLTEFYPPGDQYYWETPKWIKEAPLDFQKEYVAAFYDAEGGCRNVKRFLRGETKSMQAWASFRCKHVGVNEPLQFLQGIINKVGIKSQIYDSDELVLTGKQNLKRFCAEFPLIHPVKGEDLRELLTFFGTVSADA